MKPKPKTAWIQPSTWQFIQEARRTPGYSLLDLLHGYLYARWPYLYIGAGLGEHPLAKRLAPYLGGIERLLTRGRPADCLPPGAPAADHETVGMADTYHGKVVPLAPARQLVLVNEDVKLPDLEQVIPYKRARAIILKNPQHIVALECPCRAARPNPCLPLDVCLIIGEPFASFIIEHQPERARWITPAQAVEILEAEDARGHVHHAFFKDAMLGRFYAICNCCACCCGAMQAQRSGVPMLASSGYLAEVDAMLCIACETCTEYCQFGALSVPDSAAWVDPALCMGCGVCVSKCAQGALSLRREAGKGQPLEICTLMEAALAD
jgi:ferredoxin